MNDCATVTFRFQIAGNSVSAVLGATKQDQLIVLLQQFSDASMTPVFRNQFKHMLDIGFRLRCAGVVAHGAALITRDELGYCPVEGGRKQQHLPGGGQTIHDLAYGWQKAHVRHAVGFVKHRNLHGTQIDVSATDEVFEATWRGDHYRC